ncbi:MAG: ABC transporter substrate-binding protein [Tissierellia bacterium]|nr:ABC transporter substrate-binding protein [Tissierellia bacterium]
MTKKRIALLLALMLLTTVFLAACGGDKTPAEKPAEETTEVVETTEETTEEEGVEDVEKFADADTLVVGGAELNGSYINGFGNSTYDVWIKRMIGNYGGDLGYATTYYDEAGEFHVNPTVVNGEPAITENADGSKTYQFKINENLLWNDGNPITAKDYVFGILFGATEQWMLTGANNATTSEDLLGFDEFHDGTSAEFPGIKLVDDFTFEVTLKAEKVPYFYEIALVGVSPRPLHRYAPNVDVVGSSLVVAEGYEVTDADKAEVIKIQEGVVKKLQEAYDAELETAKEAEGFDEAELNAALEESVDTIKEEYKALHAMHADIKDAEATLAGYQDGTEELSPLEIILTTAANEVANVYRFKPDVTPGPYQFVEFGNNMAKVTINDKFVGNAEGELPKIKNVVVQTVHSKIDVDLAIAGTIDIVPGVIEGEKIDKTKANSDTVGFNSFPRNGYGVMHTISDQGATQYKGVRQAIAYSLDRNEFVQTIAGGYGSVVNGAFGINQFEYLAKGEDFLDQAINYTKNADAGNAALDTTPYLYEKDGSTPWDPAKAEEQYNSNKEGFDYWRYDENGNILRVIHEGTAELNVSELISAQIPDNAKLLGMQYIFKPVDFATMLDHYYNPNADDPEAPTVFNMGTGFAIPNDPYNAYHSSQVDTGDNRNRVNDPELDVVLETMRRADSSDVDTWNDGWLKFQLWYNENLPNIPLYANEYFDIHTNRVQNLTSTPMHDWSDLICQLEIAQ